MHEAWLSPDPITSSQPTIREQHIAHCYDYLRQAVMCAADTALEGRRDNLSLKASETDGWGTTHQCRNWGVLKEFAEENRARKELGKV